jgi:hypothetical protein
VVKFPAKCWEIVRFMSATLATQTQAPKGDVRTSAQPMTKQLKAKNERRTKQAEALREAVAQLVTGMSWEDFYACGIGDDEGPPGPFSYRAPQLEGRGQRELRDLTECQLGAIEVVCAIATIFEAGTPPSVKQRGFLKRVRKASLPAFTWSRDVRKAQAIDAIVECARALRRRAEQPTSTSAEKAARAKRNAGQILDLLDELEWFNFSVREHWKDHLVDCEKLLTLQHKNKNGSVPYKEGAARSLAALLAGAGGAASADVLKRAKGKGAYADTLANASRRGDKTM